MLTVQDWKITVPEEEGRVGFQGDNLTRRLEFQTDIPPEWTVKLDVRKGNKVNVIALAREEDRLYVDLTRDMLPASGLWSAQLRGVNGDLVRHSDLFLLYVYESVNAADEFPALPSEMAQLERQMDEAVEKAVAAAERAQNLDARTVYLSDGRTVEAALGGFATKEELDRAIRTAIQDSWEGSY